MKKRNNSLYFLLSVVSVLFFIGVWHLFTTVLEVVPSNTLPSPEKVFTSFIRKFTNPNPDGATLLQHTFASLQVALTGYFYALVLGIPLGIMMAWNPCIDRFVRPLFDLLKPIPGVAWIPLMIVIFGLGIASKAAVVFFSAVVPCVLNSYTGIKQTKDVHLWVARTFGATDRQKLFTIAIPTALPHILTGVRVALGAAWVAIVAAELLGATQGLGFMIQQSRGIYRTDIIIVGMLAIGICGGILTGILTFIADFLLKGRR